MFTDKAKTVSCTSLIEACPQRFQKNQENSYSAPNVTHKNEKKRWPSWAAGNGWAPDDISAELASLSSDEVRTIFPHISIKSYLILVMTDHYLLHLTVHIYYFIQCRAETYQVFLETTCYLLFWPSYHCHFVSGVETYRSIYNAVKVLAA